MSKPRTTSLLPEYVSQTVELADGDGLTFRKKILPYATIIYPKTKRHPGGPVTFDRAYHQDVIDSFAAHAYDNPTLQLATETNAHNMLPERAAGDVLALSHEQPDDVDGPGLYATIKAHSPEHAEMLRRNPKLGVSPEIVEGLKRVDGFKARRALRHVLATLAPRVAGLGQWRAVSLSDDEDDNGQLIDLSEAEYEETDMGSKNKGVTLELSDDDLEAALAEAASEFGYEDVDPDDDPNADPDADLTAKTKTKEPAMSLSETDTRQQVLSLAAEHEEIVLQLAEQRAELAGSKWATERQKLSLAGVPKSMLDEAGKVLGTADAAVLSLSSLDDDGDLTSEDVDAKQVIRNLLEHAKGVVELSDEIPGIAVEPGAPSEDANIKAGMDAWDARSGKVN